MSNNTTALGALLVTNGEIRKISLSADGDGSSDIHQLIGNYFTTCFSVHTTGGRTLVGYCDDEFLLKSPEALDQGWNVVLNEHGGLRKGIESQPIGGNIVITACDYGGYTVGMTPEEQDAFFVDRSRGLILGNRHIPTLCYTNRHAESIPHKEAVSLALSRLLEADDFLSNGYPLLARQRLLAARDVLAVLASGKSLPEAQWFTLGPEDNADANDED